MADLLDTGLEEAHQRLSYVGASSVLSGLKGNSKYLLMEERRLWKTALVGRAE